MRRAGKYLLLIPAFLTLAGCSAISDFFSSPEKRLEGKRISVLELEKSLEPDAVPGEGRVDALPAAWHNQFWPQAGGYPSHGMQHVMLNPGELKEVWRKDIDKHPLNTLPVTASPIFVDGKVFTLDRRGFMSAVDAAEGEIVWRLNITSEGEGEDPVIAGGLSYGEGLIYATNGFNEILAIQPQDGKIIWRQKLSGPSRSAPTVINGRVFVSTLDNHLRALSAADGSLLWEYEGVAETAKLVGAASPAANQDIVLPVFSSGEITALRVENGSVAWSDNLSSTRRLGGLDSLSDIRALPVLDQGLAIAVSFGGRMIAIDERTGTRVWQRDIGGTTMPWVVGDYVFVLSNENQLIALRRSTGAVIWITGLPTVDHEENTIAYSGPVLAGGRIVLAGSYGRIVEVNPYDGQIIRNWCTTYEERHVDPKTQETLRFWCVDHKRHFSVPPLVAGGMLYLLADDGTIFAYK